MIFLWVYSYEQDLRQILTQKVFDNFGFLKTLEILFLFFPIEIEREVD